VIKLEKIRDLDIDAGTRSSATYLSAASGLVGVGATLYVVADDDLHLAAFPVHGSAPGRLIRLFDGALPDENVDRKRVKPDLEALVHLPPCQEFMFGALLAIGSGSRANRKRGALLCFDNSGAVATPAKSVDLTFILDPLAAAFSQLNIEGAVVAGRELRLFQRGNTRLNDNAVIRYPLSSVMDGIVNGRIEPLGPAAIERFDLGAIRGTSFSFTDAAVLPTGDMIFSAVAENTEDAYLDGPCLGAGIGMIDDLGDLISFDRFEYPHKVEGVHVRQAGDVLELLLVTDADNPDIPAGLFSARIVR
jgi:hypothetical protein